MVWALDNGCTLIADHLDIRQYALLQIRTKMNNTGCLMELPGDDLRDRIAALLRIKYQRVWVEKRLTATTADVFFIDDTNPTFERPIAIEAKDWAGRLTSQNLASIANLYQPSLASREIDNLWIVGREPLSGSPRSTLDNLPHVRYSTYGEFCASLMNFSALLRNNTLVYEHDDVSKSYVHTRVKGSNKTLLAEVRDWIKSNKTGLMIYGGYGLGKTTFSLHLASVLSEEYQKGQFDRIPIRIALGGMYSKQDLTALICSALSSGEGGASVKDFSFGYFLEMNRQGQYLLILDGFDEMRHAMAIDDFVYTFEEMKPLFGDRAKIIILGRPDSFLTNSEEEAILGSLFDAKNEQLKKLAKVEVAFFSRDEIVGYLDAFLRKRGATLSPTEQRNYNILLQKIPDGDDGLLARPVQLSMFTKIIDECLSSNELINRYELYRRFIYGFISRESRKAARKLPPNPLLDDRADNDPRAEFMQAIAWWLLNVKKENRFEAEEVPIDIIPSAIKTGKTTITAIREAIVGSVIEPINQSGVLGSKAKRFYYFPHKSYLEFLIANYFESGSFKLGSYREFMEVINSEILTFIEEGPPSESGTPRGVSHLRQGLLGDLGQISPRVIEVCATDRNIAKEISDPGRHSRHPSTIYTHYFYMRENKVPADEYLIARLLDSKRYDSCLAIMNCIAAELSASGSQGLARSLIANCLTSISIHKMRQFMETGSPIQIFQVGSEGIRAAIAGSTIYSLSSGKRIRLDLNALGQLLANASHGLFYVPLTYSSANKEIEIATDVIAKAAGTDFEPMILRLAKKARWKTPLIPIRLIGDALTNLRL